MFLISGLPLWIAPTLEVGSDIVGLISSVVMANASYRLLTARRVLHVSGEGIKKEIADIEKKINTPNADPGRDLSLLNQHLARFKEALCLIEKTDASASGYQQQDLDELKLGMLLLATSFAMKILFHLIKT